MINFQQSLVFGLFHIQRKTDLGSIFIYINLLGKASLCVNFLKTIFYFRLKERPFTQQAPILRNKKQQNIKLRS